MRALLPILALSMLGCSGTLQGAYQRNLDGRYGGKLTAVPSAECRSIDRARTHWRAIQVASAALGGGSGLGGVTIPEYVNHRGEWQASLGISAAVFAATAIAAGEEVAALDTEWIAKCVK